MFFNKKSKLEKQLMDEIKRLAKVNEFPYQDRKVIEDLLAAYNMGSPFEMLTMMSAINTLEKYPDLIAEWDQLMIKYKSLGLFPNWHITPF